MMSQPASEKSIITGKIATSSDNIERLSAVLEYSKRLYVRLAPADTRLFRYLLEGHDNLAYTSVVERKGCILKIVFAPGQKQEVLQVLEGISQSIDISILDVGQDIALCTNRR